MAQRTNNTLVIISLDKKYYEILVNTSDELFAVYDVLQRFVGFNLLEVYQQYTDGVEDYNVWMDISSILENIKNNKMNIQTQLETLRINYPYTKVLVYDDCMVYHSLGRFGKKIETELNQLIQQLNIPLIAKHNIKESRLFGDSVVVEPKI
jgi:lysyl-tRNA synthetase class II